MYLIRLKKEKYLLFIYQNMIKWISDITARFQNRYLERSRDIFLFYKRSKRISSEINKSLTNFQHAILPTSIDICRQKLFSVIRTFRDDLIIHVATTNVIMTLTFLPTHPPQLTSCRGTSFSLSYISLRLIFIQSGCAVMLPEHYQDPSGYSE